MTQCEMIIDMTKDGWVSPLDALSEAGCMRLSARIHDLKKDGFEFEERTDTSVGRFGKKSFKSFRLKRSESQSTFNI